MQHFLQTGRWDNRNKLTVYNDKRIKFETGELLKRDSNNSVILQLEFEDRWADFNKYIEFETAEKKWCELLKQDTYAIPIDVTENESIEMDIAFKKTENDDTTQDFSQTKTVYFEPSINANPEVIEKHKDVIDQIVEEIDDLQEEVSANTAARHTHPNKSILDDTTASYTTEAQSKLANIESNAEVNKIEKIKVNGTEQTITNKSVDINVMDNTVNNLINYYLKTETYTQEEVNALIGAITTLNIEVVQSLPTQDISTNTIYFVPKNPAETDNIYDEYIYVNNSWELIGTTEVDLTHYVQDTDYATSSKAGVIKTGYGAGLLSDGKIFAGTRTYAQYQNDDNKFFISKGTLENVLTERIGNVETLLTNLNTDLGNIITEAEAI